jgi:hypothetical protein
LRRSAFAWFAYFAVNKKGGNPLSEIAAVVTVIIS